MKLTFRFLTTFCYFLPFTFFLMTCNGLSIDIAYNKKDAEKNFLLAKNPGMDSVKTDAPLINASKISETSQLDWSINNIFNQADKKNSTPTFVLNCLQDLPYEKLFYW